MTAAAPVALAAMAGATVPRAPPGRRVLFLATCLCDGFFDTAARAAVETLETAGCTVELPPGQTCCGQPAFNAGAWPEARRVFRTLLRAFREPLPVVVPSSSCAAMIRHGALLAFEHEPDREAVAELAGRTWEFAEYLVEGLGLRDWPGTYRARVAFHRSCHTRGSNSAECARRLLAGLSGLDLVDVPEADTCCGFGGAFSVGFPYLSGAMGRRKIGNLRSGSPDCIVALDAGCLLHLGGMLDRQGVRIPRRHLAEVLHDARTGRGPA